MNQSDNRQFRWNAIKQILRLETRRLVLDWGIYIVLSIALLGTVLVLQNSMNYMKEYGFVVLSEVFDFSIQGFAVILSIYLSIVLITSITREKTLGQIQILFFGPVDEISYILAKFFASVLITIYSMVLFVVAIVLISMLTNIKLPAYPVELFIITFLCMASVNALSIFLATQSRSYRNAIMKFLLIAILLILFIVVNEILSTIDPGKYYDALHFSKVVFTDINNITNWISPFSLLNVGILALSDHQPMTFISNLFVLIGEIGLFISLAVHSLKRSGVRP